MFSEGSLACGNAYIKDKMLR